MTVSELDLHRPEESTQADVTLVARGLTVTACVDRSDEFGLVVRPEGEGTAWMSSVQPGDSVEVYWISGYEERTLPARVTSVEEAVDCRWHLAPTGPAETSQRRKAVRARVELPIVMPWAGSLLTGTTVDISESGVKALVAGWGLPPDAGTPAGVSVTLDEAAVVDLPAEVVWHVVRGTQWLIALRFLDVSEDTADVLRRRVFQALREERSRVAD